MLQAFRRSLALIPVALLILLVAACGGTQGGDDDSGDQAQMAATGVPLMDGLSDRDDAAAPIPGGEANTSEQSQDFGRKIVRTAEINLAIEDLDSALADVRRIASVRGGFVGESNIVVNNSEDDQVARPERAIITLRVPATQFDEAMAQLRDSAAGVDAENTSVAEVTGEYTDLQSRLRNLEASEAQYLALLERATTIDEILRVQSSVDSIRGSIEQAQGRLNVLDDQVDMSTITVNLRLVSAPIVVKGDTHWAVQAWETSRDVSLTLAVVLGTIAIAGGVISLWLIPITVLVFIFWRRFGTAISALARKVN